MAFGGNSNFGFLIQNLREYMDIFDSEELSYASETTAEWKLELIKILGQLEGQRIKSLGLISSEFNELLREYFDLFQLEASETETLRVPFQGKSLVFLERDAKDTEAARVFLESLFSVYGGTPVHCQWERRKSGAMVLSLIQSTVEKKEPEGDFTASKELRHKINNYLSGILSLSSLLKKKHPMIEEMPLIEDSAQKLKSVLNSGPT